MHRQVYNTRRAAIESRGSGGGVTRRNFISTLAAAASPSNAPGRLLVPVHRVMDSRAQCPPEQVHYFWSSIWPEAVRDFSQGGIGFEVSDGPGEVRRSPGDKPIFIGLRRGVLNLVLTGHIPMKWDSGRSSAGVTTIYDGYQCACSRSATRMAIKCLSYRSTPACTRCCTRCCRTSS